MRGWRNTCRAAAPCKRMILLRISSLASVSADLNTTTIRLNSVGFSEQLENYKWLAWAGRRVDWWIARTAPIAARCALARWACNCLDSLRASSKLLQLSRQLRRTIEVFCWILQTHRIRGASTCKIPSPDTERSFRLIAAANCVCLM